MSKLTTNEHFIQKQQLNWLLIIGVILVGSNLRAPLTSVGSLIPYIRDDLAMNNTVAGMVTTLPLLAFALLSPIVAKISNRMGMEWTMFLSLLLLMIGIIIRSLFGITFLFLGTSLIGLAIAVGNVLLPGFIKVNFPLQIGLMTGIYAVSMNLFGAIASGISFPISLLGNIGWRGSLGIWAVLTIAAIIFWLPQLRNQKDPIHIGQEKSTQQGNIWRSSLAWYITIFMGMQSLLFYTLITWLPELLQSTGFSSSASGWLLFLMLFAIIPVTFLVPLIAERLSDQKLLSVIVASLFLIGVISLLFNNQVAIIIAMILLGIGCGSAFSLSMMFFSLRTNDGQQAAEMSGMAQSFGYLLAATGPVLFGALYDLTASWVLPIVMLIVVTCIFLFAGIIAGEDRVIEQTTEKI